MSNKRRRTCNSWTETRSDLLYQWDFIKNDDMPADCVFSQRAWWLCNVDSCGHGCPHSWQATLGNRMYGYGCPYCVKKKFCTHFSLEAKEPELAQEFDTERNGGLQAKDVYYHSSQNVWWKCTKSTCGCPHIFFTSVSNRTRLSSGCPYCFGRKVCKHESLAVKRPDVLKFWNYAKNKGIDPETVSVYSNMMVWWKCTESCRYGCVHEWKTYIATVSAGHGCPCCYGRNVCVHNSIAHLVPGLLEEWSADNTKSPSELAICSMYYAKWKCKTCSREWQATVESRAYKGTGCMSCMRGTSKMEILMGKTLDDLGTQSSRWSVSSSMANVWSLLRGSELDRVVKLKLPSGNEEVVAIEMDGIQHFKAVDFFGGEEGFAATQFRDRRKNDNCQIIRAHLLRIGYDVSNDDYGNIVSAFFDRVAAQPSVWQFQCVGKHYQHD